MAIDTTWTDPSESGTLDLAAGGIVTEAIWEDIMSNLKRLGGTDGDTKTGDMKYGANKVYINDDANTGQTVGQTINQGANDNEIFALKSSDIAHGITGLAETDTYGFFQKVSSTGGGTQIFGISEGTGYGMVVTGITTGAVTGKTTGSGAGVVLSAATNSGVNLATYGADGNLVAIQDYFAGTTRFIFDIEGSAHADVEWVAYDKHNDLAIIADIEAELLRREDVAQTERRHHLESIGIIGEGSWHFEDGRPKAMVNFSRLAMLHHGALLQVGSRLQSGESDRAMLWQAITELIERNLALETRIARLGVN